jgi:hypothetical protein
MMLYNGGTIGHIYNLMARSYNSIASVLLPVIVESSGGDSTILTVGRFYFRIRLRDLGGVESGASW